MPQRVYIQGYEGSFHHQAARFYFGQGVQPLPCSSFRELVQRTVAGGEEDFALMAIENSIAGSILPNYTLLQQSGLRILGEIYLSIRQQLLVNPGVRLEDIREVHSHPMALQQCVEFLDKHSWKLVETEDTALSARQLQQYHSVHIAAIGSLLAARLFKLKVLARNIHSQKNNYTRFLVLSRGKTGHSGTDVNKASLNFQTDHTRGSLAKVLGRIAEAGINLSKLQSMPIPGTDFKYSFHVDMEFEKPEHFHSVLEAIRPITRGLSVYGIYKKGIWK